MSPFHDGCQHPAPDAPKYNEHCQSRPKLALSSLDEGALFWQKAETLGPERIREQAVGSRHVHETGRRMGR